MRWERRFGPSGPKVPPSIGRLEASAENHHGIASEHGQGGHNLGCVVPSLCKTAGRSSDNSSSGQPSLQQTARQRHFGAKATEKPDQGVASATTWKRAHRTETAPPPPLRREVETDLHGQGKRKPSDLKPRPTANRRLRSMESRTRLLRRRFLGNKKSTIQKVFFGRFGGDGDSVVTSGGWQGGGYPTRMKPPCQFSHPAITGNRVPVRFVYDV